MITVRNPKECGSLTVLLSEAATVGEVVAVIQGTAKGEPVQVRRALEADLEDATVPKGVIDWTADNDLAADFILDPTLAGQDGLLTVNAGADSTVAIPSGAWCTMRWNKPIIGFYKSVLDASLDIDTVREGDKLAFDSVSKRLAAYNSGGLTGTQIYMGYVYRVDGPEVTAVLSGL